MNGVQDGFEHRSQKHSTASRRDALHLRPIQAATAAMKAFFLANPRKRSLAETVAVPMTRKA